MMSICFIFLFNYAIAEVPPFLGFLDSKRDTNYILDVSDHLTLRLFTSGKYNELQLKNNIINQAIVLHPNDRTNIGVGFSYKWLGLGIAFSFPFLNRDDDIYGSTHRFDFQLNTYGKKICFDAAIQYYKGFYLKNVSKLVNWQADSFPKLPEMETYSLGLNSYYIFKHKTFSYRSVFMHNELQRKSAGSFILGGFITFNYGNSSTHFLSRATLLRNKYDSIFNLVAYKAFHWGVTYGYAHTFVIWKNYYLHLSFTPKLGICRITTGRLIDGQGAITTNTNLSGGLDFRVAISGEQKHFYWGITTVSTNYNYKIPDWEIKPVIGNTNIFIGKRF